MTKTEVEKLEDDRCAAMLANDLTKMGALFSDEMLWVHGSGIVDTKQSFLERFQLGTARCYRLDLTEVIVRIFGSTAVVIGSVEMDAEFAGKRAVVLSRFTDVWSGEGGTPQLVSWQSARLGAAS